MPATEETTACRLLLGSPMTGCIAPEEAEHPAASGLDYLEPFWCKVEKGGVDPVVDRPKVEARDVAHLHAQCKGKPAARVVLLCSRQRF